MRSQLLFSCLVCIAGLSQAQVKYSHADSLKGSYSKERSWWDVTHYDLHVGFNIQDSSVSGYNTIRYKVVQPYQVMQLDLMTPMVIDSIIQDSKKLQWRDDGNAHFVTMVLSQVAGARNQVVVYFHGKPRAAKNPPWDGGVVWSADTHKNPFISVACQGMAAQVWFPNKDHMADEADSASMHFTVPRTLVAVSNGRLRGIGMSGNEVTYSWAVVNPINNYNIIPYIGKYIMFTDTFNGRAGVLDLSFWVLQDNYETAKNHFLQVKSMLRCFEDWFGPYPFYADGYKLVEAPFLGMEHQSAIAYGNGFRQGYLGRDLSGTGWGLKWDFIIVHESGHEWFGNSISAGDVADNWIHEGFTAYSENLFTECLYGKKAGSEYVIGTRKAVLNDKPVIADYNVNSGGSLDVYYKASNMLHTVRQVVNNDSLWKEMLRAINARFRHQVVTTAQVEEFMSSFLKINLQPVFNQYLRTVNIPVLEYRVKRKKMQYRWSNCVKDFNMRVLVNVDGTKSWISPLPRWQSMENPGKELSVDDDFFIRVNKKR
jgi:aminopeptidase N